MAADNGSLDKAQRSLLLTSSVVFLAQFIPFLNLALLPLQYLYTHLHELGHAIVAMGTGGEFIRITLEPNGSGLTTSYGGWQLFISPAGYVGATAFGAIVLAMSRTTKGAQVAFRILAVVMALGMLLWIRGAFGLGTGFFYTLLLGWLGYRNADERTQWLAQFLGVFLSLSSIQAVVTTLHLGGISYGEDDAMILEKASGIPAVFSAVLWTAASLAITWWALRRAWSRG